MSNTKLQRLSDKELKEISQTENIPVDYVKQFFLKSQDGKYYVTKAGLLYMLSKKYSKFTIQISVPVEDEMKRLLCMLQVKNTDRFVIMKCEIVTEDGTYVDYGTSSDITCRAAGYLIEFASTRATARALRLATSIGYCSVEEIEQDVNTDKSEIEKQVVVPVKEQTAKTEEKLSVQRLRENIVKIIIEKSYDKNLVGEFTKQVFKKDLSKLNCEQLNELIMLLNNDDNKSKFVININDNIESKVIDLDQLIMSTGKEAGFNEKAILASIKDKWGKNISQLSDEEKKNIIEKLKVIAVQKNSKQLQKAA